MEYVKYLSARLPKKECDWLVILNEILMSNSLQISQPYDEHLSLLLLKYKKRMTLSQLCENRAIGLEELISKLSLYPDSQKAIIYPMGNKLFTGECVVINEEVVGCAFINRGRSSFKEGLWVDGRKID